MSISANSSVPVVLSGASVSATLLGSAINDIFTILYFVTPKNFNCWRGFGVSSFAILLAFTSAAFFLCFAVFGVEWGLFAYSVTSSIYNIVGIVKQKQDAYVARKFKKDADDGVREARVDVRNAEVLYASCQKSAQKFATEAAYGLEYIGDDMAIVHGAELAARLTLWSKKLKRLAKKARRLVDEGTEDDEAGGDSSRGVLGVDGDEASDDADDDVRRQD